MGSDHDGAIRIGDVLPSEPGIVRFLDTIWADRDGPHDDLATGAHAAAWLSQVGYAQLLDLTSSQTSALRELRDALRRLAAHRTEDRRERAVSPLAIDEAVDLVNAIAGASTPGPQIAIRGHTTIEQVPQGKRQVADVLRVLAREGVEALTPPDDLPLRACLAPSCVLYYVQDHPRRAWCSAACGNRARAARHYARVRG
jgi:predicted RNA-binding Zn ribbon-like protein